MKLALRIRLWIAVIGAAALLAAQPPRAPGQAPAALKPGAPEKPTAPERPREIGKSCRTSECHVDIGAGPVLHGPIAQDACLPCHVVVDPAAHTFALKDNSAPSMCLQCHELYAGGGAPAVVAPGGVKSVHKPVNESCVSCHVPHGGASRSLLKTKGVAESCAECHPDLTRGMPVVHGPVDAGACLACHDAHFSAHTHLLKAAERELCFQCHQEKLEDMLAATSIHQPVADGCVNCHQPHAAPKKNLLLREPAANCKLCHEAFIKSMTTKETQHRALTEGDQCLNCHDPHFSRQSFLLEQVSMGLCLECHNRRIEMPPPAPDGGNPALRQLVRPRVLTDVANELQDNPFHHGPIREKNCVDCHKAHGSDHPSLLTAEFPRRFYASWEEKTYALCFECHDERLASTEIMPASGAATTAFRNGAQNMHYLHTHRSKGRTCRACHAEHASRQPHHVRESVPYGSWTLSIEYTQTATGGGCLSGCHTMKKYDRDKPVKNEPSEPLAAVSNGGRVFQPANAATTSTLNLSEPIPASGVTTP